MRSSHTIALALVFGFFSNSVLTYHFQEESPLRWKIANKQIITGYMDVLMTYDLLSPCDIIFSNTADPDWKQFAKHECQHMYNVEFLDQLGKVCRDSPDGEEKEVHTSSAYLFVPSTQIQIAGVIAIGLDLGEFSISAANTGQPPLSIPEELETLKAKLNSTKEMNDIIAKIKSTPNQFTEAYIASYLEVYLLHANKALEDQTDLLAVHKMSTRFLDIFKFELPCGNQCALDMVTPLICTLSSDKSQVNMNFLVPVIDSNLVQMIANPFKLMVKVGSQMCSSEYEGESSIIVNSKDSCVYFDYLAKYFNEETVFVNKYDDCQTTNEEIGSYLVESCENTTALTTEEFVDVRVSNMGKELLELEIYCRGSNITIGNKSLVCPDFVFSLEAPLEFISVGHFKKNFSGYATRKQENVQPFFALTSNMTVKVFDDQPEMTNGSNLWRFLCILAITVVMVLIPIICAARWYKSRKCTTTVQYERNVI